MKYLMKSNSFAESKRYLKLFEKREISDDEKKLNNLARRLEYNLNKFFKSVKIEYSNIYVNAFYHNMSDSESISIGIQNIPKNSNEFLIFLQKFNELRGKYFITYDLDKEKAEELLLSIKKNFPNKLIELDMKKYNL